MRPFMNVWAEIVFDICDKESWNGHIIVKTSLNGIPMLQLLWNYSVYMNLYSVFRYSCIHNVHL